MLKKAPENGALFCVLEKNGENVDIRIGKLIDCITWKMIIVQSIQFNRVKKA